MSASRRLMCRKTIFRRLSSPDSKWTPVGISTCLPDAVLEFLAHDLPATDGLVLAAAQAPIRASALLDRVTEAAWHTKPSWYAVTVEDRTVYPALQRLMASRINASVLVLRAGHVPFLSKPKETADVILTAVDFVRQKG
jgi:pimeloyl-ACP methyl ester carboxylesterase